ncbi:MAG: HDOD domain-containing protein, partial [Methylococcaceae bacterium]|nr:HDOD domain-containing protein [Methylococcaceae bacterium]
LHQEWKNSVHLASLCHVLASENAGVDPGEALLAGLICDIGKFPILHFAENFPRKYWNPEDLQAALETLHRRVGVYVLARWDFPRELTELPMIAEEWLHNSGPKLTLSDIVILAKLHSYIGTPKSYGLPTINSIPAFGKLEGGGLNPEHTLNVLHAAKEKTAHSMSLLQG